MGFIDDNGVKHGLFEEDYKNGHLMIHNYINGMRYGIQRQYWRGRMTYKNFVDPMDVHGERYRVHYKYSDNVMCEVWYTNSIVFHIHKEEII